jgi:hypothetical protein
MTAPLRKKQVPRDMDISRWGPVRSERLLRQAINIRQSMIAAVKGVTGRSRGGTAGACQTPYVTREIPGKAVL